LFKKNKNGPAVFPVALVGAVSSVLQEEPYCDSDCAGERQRKENHLPDWK
jgi:hypothetical protein